MSAMESSVRQALEWVAEQLREHPDANRGELLDEACTRFSLSTLDAEFLYRQFPRRQEAA